MASVLTARLAEEAEGDDRRVASVHLHDDGCVHVSGAETGPKVRNFWDHDTYEYWVRIPSAEVGKLVFHLLRERYAGNANAAADFRKFCDEHGIDHSFESWF